MTLVLLLSLTSCDNSLDYIDTKKGAYAIYGALDLDKETNYIRIRDLKTPFTLEATREIDAEVTLENLQTGSIQVLESERQEYQGIYVHNYVVNGLIQPDTEYRVTARRPNGVETSVTATTPTKPPPVINPINEKCDIPVSVSIEPLNGGTVVLRFGLGPSEDDPWGILLEFGPDRYGNSNSTGLTFVPIEMVRLISRSSRNCADLLRNDILYMRVAHYAPGFYEQLMDEIDEPDDILESSRRFGAFYENTLSIPLDTSPN